MCGSCRAIGSRCCGRQWRAGSPWTSPTRRTRPWSLTFSWGCNDARMEEYPMTPERPDVVDEADYWYRDNLTGRRLAFRPKPGEAVVTLVGTPNQDALPGLLSGPAVRSISRGANLR